MLALHHTPVGQTSLSVHSLIEKGQAGMPVLHFGGTGRTRTLIVLVDNQVPHLSATAPLGFRIADFRIRIHVASEIKVGWVEGS